MPITYYQTLSDEKLLANDAKSNSFKIQIGENEVEVWYDIDSPDQKEQAEKIAQIICCCESFIN